MARALLGHLGNPADQLLVLEVARLRRRVTELESENAALRAEHSTIDELDLQSLVEPALA